MTDPSNFRRGIRDTLAGNLLVALCNFLTGILLAKSLGPSGRGDLAAIQVAPTFIATLGLLGMLDAIVFFCARDRRRFTNFVVSALILVVAFSPLFIGLNFFTVGFLLHKLSPRDRHVAHLYSLLIFLFALLSIPQHALRGAGATKLWNTVRLFPPFAWLAAILICLATGTANPIFLAKIFLFCMAASVPPTWLLMRGHLQIPRSLQSADFRSLLRFGFPSLLVAIPQTLNLRVDQIIMSATIPASSLGLYVAAVAWSGAVAPIGNAVASMTFPQVAAESDNERRFRNLITSFHIGVIAVFIPGAFLAAITPFVFPIIFGAPYRSASAVACVLVVASMVIGLNGLLQEGLRGLNEPNSVLLSELCGLVITIISLALLLKPFGIMGAGLASLLGYSATCIYLAVKLHRISGQSWTDLFLPTANDLELVTQRFRVRFAMARGK